jgi:adenylosuccinate synthase
MPATYRGMLAIEPVYEKLPGWKTSTRGLSRNDGLPEPAQRYLEFLEQRTGVEIGCVSTGPERNETIIRGKSKLARLFGL